MVLPIGGFMPIPLAMMIPFMATQSLVMGHAFGEAFQYGKRKISAMSNEEFNKLRLEDLAANMFKSYQFIIPDLKTSIGQSTDLQNFIVAKLLDMPREIFGALGGAAVGIGGAGTPGGEVAVGKKTPGESFVAPVKTPVSPRDPNKTRKNNITNSIDQIWRRIKTYQRTIDARVSARLVPAQKARISQQKKDARKQMSIALFDITKLKFQYKKLFGTYPPKSSFAL